MKTQTINDVIKEAADAPDLCRYNHGNDCIYLDDGNYEIDLDRVPDKARLLEWVHHLSGKRWVTTDTIYEFIELVLRVKGWDH